VTLGCRAHRTVAATARASTARVLLVVMAPLAGTMGAVSSPLVCSCGDVSTVDVQESSMEEPSEVEPKCRMEATITFVSGSAILLSSSLLFLPLFVLMIFSSTFTQRLKC
jgi:hypothetical protein